jgi:pimeloyl-ACP methyl ester carboxylesterase
MTAESGTLSIGDATLEVRRLGPPPEAAPTLVLLHEGLGSVGLWGDFPDRLAAATGAGVVAYSRAGYGQSSPARLPRALDFLEREALDVLPRVLEAIGFRRGLLVGHSDGASIATIYAGGVQDHRIRGLSLMAPHFFVEDETIVEIERARDSFERGALKERLSRWHADVDQTFRGWVEAWLDPALRRFDITEALGYIRVPVQVIQGEADRYGTACQVQAPEEECYCPVETHLLPGIGHSPHREAPDLTLRLVAAFANRILHDHGEARAA